jgi:hypothetical protein
MRPEFCYPDLVADIRAGFMARQKIVPLFQQSSIPMCRASHTRKIRQCALEKQFFPG